MHVLAPIFGYLMAVISIGAAGFAIVGIVWTIAEALEANRE